MPATDCHQNSITRLSQKVAVGGLVLYAIFAPHPVAASTIGVAVASVSWLIRSAASGGFGLHRSRFDLIILLNLLWTALTAFLSAEPTISIAKLQASWCVLMFYLTRALVTRRTAFGLIVMLIISATAGVCYSAYDLLRGRGVVVEAISADSPFRLIELNPGDTVWRIAGQRVYSVADIDTSLRRIPPSQPLTVSIISQGEQVERKGLQLTSSNLALTSTSGLTGTERNHKFRASGWTRHYETFSELLQMIALVAMGIAFANFRNHGTSKIFKIALLASAVLALGIVFTAMRTALVAFLIGASCLALSSLQRMARLLFVAALLLVLGIGAVVVQQTRGKNALRLGDPSSSLRWQVARVGLSRIMIHPIFGHGMDAVHAHWNEWGFPGKDMLHLHSTPLQVAFDRGLPMLGLWIWMMLSFWISLWRESSAASNLPDTNSYGILLGVFGAMTGFLASSLVNYNYGDSEVVMLFWFLMGISVAIGDELSAVPFTGATRRKATRIKHVAHLLRKH